MCPESPGGTYRGGTMSKIEFTKQQIYFQESPDGFNGSSVKDTDGDPKTHADKFYRHLFSPQKPVTETDLQGRMKWRGYSRAELVLVRESFATMMQNTQRVLELVGAQGINPSRLNGLENEVSFSFSPKGTLRYRVGCELDDELAGCQKIRIDEFIYSNPHWDDPNPYYEVNTYLFGAEILEREELPFADTLKPLFSRWREVLK